MPVKSVAIDPCRTDIVFKLLSVPGKGNPFYTGLAYFLVSYAALALLGIVTGSFPGTSRTRLNEKFLVDTINLALLAPIGAGLLCHFYNCVTEMFSSLQEKHIIPDASRDSFMAFLPRAERAYNNMFVVIGALVVSVVINVYHYWLRADSWMGINGGLPAIYGRLVIVVNYFMLIVIVYKCAVTVWILRHILNYEDIIVQPLHPDKCGGLLPLGRLALAINYFVTLTLIFFAVLFLFDPVGREPAYIALYVMFYVCAPVLLFTPVSRANRRMKECKTDALRELNRAFNHYYGQLRPESEGDGLAMGPAESIARVYGLYEIVVKMPVWPFDAGSFLRLVAPFLVPAVLFVVERVARGDSALFRLMEWLPQAVSQTG